MSTSTESQTVTTNGLKKSDSHSALVNGFASKYTSLNGDNDQSNGAASHHSPDISGVNGIKVSSDEAHEIHPEDIELLKTKSHEAKWVSNEVRQQPRSSQSHANMIPSEPRLRPHLPQQLRLRRPSSSQTRISPRRPHPRQHNRNLRLRRALLVHRAHRSLHRLVPSRARPRKFRNRRRYRACSQQSQER